MTLRSAQRVFDVEVACWNLLFLFKMIFKVNSSRPVVSQSFSLLISMPHHHPYGILHAACKTHSSFKQRIQKVDKHMNLHEAKSNALRPLNAAIHRVKVFGLEKHILIGRAQCCCFLRPTRCQLACMPANFGPRSSWTLKIFTAALCRSHAWRFYREFWESNLLLHGGAVCFAGRRRRNRCNFTGSGQLANSGIGWLKVIDSNSNTLCGISLAIFGASNCLIRQTKDAFGDLQNDIIRYIQKPPFTLQEAKYST